MYIYEEIIDVGPQFMVTRTLCREVNPKYVLTFGHSAENYVKQLIDIVNDENTTNTTDGVRNLPQNFFLLSLKEYSKPFFKYILPFFFKKTVFSLRIMQTNTFTSEVCLI